MLRFLPLLLAGATLAAPIPRAQPMDWNSIVKPVVEGTLANVLGNQINKFIEKIPPAKTAKNAGRRVRAGMSNLGRSVGASVDAFRKEWTKEPASQEKARQKPSQEPTKQHSPQEQERQKPSKKPAKQQSFLEQSLKPTLDQRLLNKHEMALCAKKLVIPNFPPSNASMRSLHSLTNRLDSSQLT